jgi:hypothetical protein
METASLTPHDALPSVLHIIDEIANANKIQQITNQVHLSNLQQQIRQKLLKMPQMP